MVDITRELYDAADEEKFIFKVPDGINEEVVRKISEYKKEPEWMLEKRLNALKIFNELKMPNWGPDLSKLDIQKICYFAIPDAEHNANSWDKVPDSIKQTFERLGIPEAERKSLAGAGAQYDSQVVYHNLREDLAKRGVIFEDMDVAVQKYPELVKKYYMNKCVSPRLHKFAALHGAVWSGGTFIYVPKNVKVDMPLQAYFRMNAASMGQFEHTLIIVDEGAECHYIEGCFTEGNLVTTNPDYKSIENIKSGEKVLTSEGEYKYAKDIQRYDYSGDIYEIEYYGDSTQKISTTPEHPFLYVDRKYKNDKNKSFVPRWNAPKYFEKGDYLAIPINKEVKTKKSHVFDVYMRKNNEKNMKIHKVKVPLIKEFYRLVGYYLAEGSISSNSYLNFSFNIKEKEYVEDVKYCLKKVFGIDKVLEMVHKKNNGVNLVVCNVELARLFKQLGSSADNKALLSFMMYESLANQKEIIKGWFRGDGNYYNKKHESGLKEAFRINTVSEKLVRQARDMLLRLGVFGFINKRVRNERKEIFTLGITGEHMVKFGDIVGIKVKDKVNGKKRASMFGIDDKFAYVPIKKITKQSVKDITVYNFGVEAHETYTVGGVAVHNCSAPKYNTASMHAGCVELFVHKNARMRYSSVENWSSNTYNLNTKRAVVEENGVVEWVSGNLGSGVTMLYPASVLIGAGSKADHVTIAYGGKGQNQDTGAKVYHLAPRTTSTVNSKSISKDGGITGYRGLVKIKKGAKGAKCSVICDALMFDNKSQSNTWPSIDIEEKESTVVHEASVGRISEDQLFYLQSRGLSEEQALQLIVSGFIEPLLKELPLEYAVEMNKLIELEMEGSLG